MDNRTKILDFLRARSDEQYCDDCLSDMLDIHPRQQVNQICRKLFEEMHISRERRPCSRCSKLKLVSRYGKEPPSFDNPLSTRSILTRDNHEKRLHYDAFEQRVAEHLYNKFDKKFESQSLLVGPNKSHNFDLVSEDKSIVVECKSYTWTETGNFPSAKISTAIEALFYLSRIKARKKILVFQDDVNKRGESLADVFVRRYDGIMDDVEVWAYTATESIEIDNVRIVREPKESWYRRLWI